MAKDNNKADSKIRFLIILLVAVSIIWALYLFLLPKVFPENWATLGQFGDMFGAVNALFAAFAFAGLIYAILLQRKELELQRDELKLTREELKGQKEQLEAQNTTWKKQTFENTFF